MIDFDLTTRIGVRYFYWIKGREGVKELLQKITPREIPDEELEEITKEALREIGKK